ncbi:MAG: hypothetical protein WDO24_29805 [Pseudomonadota bacterium]
MFVVEGGNNSDFNASDPSNPVPAIPFIELDGGTNALLNNSLPTASFPGTYPTWMDADAFLRSTNGSGPDPYYRIQYDLTSDVTITTVPEPPAIALLGTSLLILVLGGFTRTLKRLTAN